MDWVTNPFQRWVDKYKFMKFSERLNLTKPKHIIQVGEMDNDLRVGLWNCVVENFLKSIHGHSYSQYSDDGRKLFVSIYKDFLKWPIDRINTPEKDYEVLRNFFLSEWKWFQVYDFCEFLGKSGGVFRGKFIQDCNGIFTRELSGYRFISEAIVPISSKEEVDSIRVASELGGKYKESGDHIKKSLEFLSKKPVPEYSASMQESIKAVEAICRLLADKPDSTLGGRLDEMLKSSTFNDEKILLDLLKIFWRDYFSNFVRHAEKPQSVIKSKIEFVEAKFSLVMCSATVNFLKDKYGK